MAAAQHGDDDDGRQRWEGALVRTWEGVLGDDTDAQYVAKLAADSKKRHRSAADVGSVRRGMLRSVVLAVDLSKAIDIPDMKPSRLKVLVSALERFITEFLCTQSA
jgi:hypothetical protein